MHAWNFWTDDSHRQPLSGNESNKHSSSSDPTQTSPTNLYCTHIILLKIQQMITRVTMIFWRLMRWFWKKFITPHFHFVKRPCLPSVCLVYVSVKYFPALSGGNELSSKYLFSLSKKNYGRAGSFFVSLSHSRI